jgi:hypothetical protein
MRRAGASAATIFHEGLFLMTRNFPVPADRFPKGIEKTREHSEKVLLRGT